MLKLNSTEKFLVPDAAAVYKKPPTLLNMLTNYRIIAHNESFQRDVRADLSHPCNKCALCGNFRYYNGKSMVPTVNHIKTAQGKLFFLKQNLTCSNYGIYAAQFKICQKIYVGQTIGVARIFDRGGPKPQITCNDVIRNFQKKNFLWSKDIAEWKI